MREKPCNPSISPHEPQTSNRPFAICDAACLFTRTCYTTSVPPAEPTQHRIAVPDLTSKALSWVHEISQSKLRWSQRSAIRTQHAQYTLAQQYYIMFLSSVQGLLWFISCVFLFCYPSHILRQDALAQQHCSDTTAYNQDLALYGPDTIYAPTDHSRLLTVKSSGNIYMPNNHNTIQSSEIARSFRAGKGEMAERSKAPA